MTPSSEQRGILNPDYGLIYSESIGDDGFTGRPRTVFVLFKEGFE